jgi:hypothetical protein
MFDSATAADNETNNAAAGIIPFLNQKVSGYYAVSGIPENFSLQDYKKALEKTCYSSPACKKQAEAIFKQYNISVEKLGIYFRVLYCDPEKTRKIMEDFSCNSTCVEIKTYKISDTASCSFENAPQSIVEKLCVRGVVCD